MKYFRYILTDDEQLEYKGEVESVPSDFFKANVGLYNLNAYYKLKDGKISEMIGEAYHEDGARKRVEEFVSSFLAISFEPL